MPSWTVEGGAATKNPLIMRFGLALVRLPVCGCVPTGTHLLAPRTCQAACAQLVIRASAL